MRAKGPSLASVEVERFEGAFFSPFCSCLRFFIVIMILHVG